MSKSSSNTLTLPRPGQIWISKEKIGTKFYLVQVISYPLSSSESPYNDGVGAVGMRWPEWYTKKQKWYWQGAVDTLVSFMKSCRPATKSEMLLYGSKGWGHLTPNEYGIILASDRS